ncbi:MAG: glycosyltransferase [Candidatus Altiarchaeota archaeon]
MKTADCVFEVSQEVCNKVGGIYQVLKSKAYYMSREYGEKYHTLGPYNAESAKIEFEEQEPPEEVKKAFSRLERKGIRCRWGIWLIGGRPKTILLEPTALKSQVNEIKKNLWEKYQVDSIRSDQMFNDSVVWSTSAGMFLEELMKEEKFKKLKCVAHFHEWLAGGALLYLKKNKVRIGTVFTTHATTLGRTIVSSNEDLYRMIEEGKDGEENLRRAGRFDISAKHTTELACARECDVLTTVSKVTAREVRFILGREPDILTLNGIDFEKYPGLEDLTILRRKNRMQMRDFLIAYFSRYYEMDFYNIRSMFISGRYEFHNKGIDLFIEALGKLNEKMKKDQTDKTVIVFFWIPKETRGEDFQVLKNKALYEELHDHVAEYLPEVEDMMIGHLVKGEIPKDLISDEFMQTCKKLAAHFTEKRGQSPPLCAYQLATPEDDDQIIRAFKQNQLLNRKEDKVKVIFYPSYLSPADRLISLDYNEATITCDVGVFPSYYEPWGYTPLETIAQGSLAITTDCAGFGKFIEGRGRGVHVLKIEGRRWEDIVEDLAKKLYEIANLTKNELSERRINAKMLSTHADWGDFVKNYIVAHDLAVEKAFRSR